MTGRDDETLPDPDLGGDPALEGDPPADAAVPVDDPGAGAVAADPIDDGPAPSRVDLDKHETTEGVDAPLFGNDIEGDELDEEVAADQGARPADDDPPRRSSGLVLGGVLVALVVLLGALFLLTRDSAGPAYTVYGEATSREELREQLDGLVPDEVIDTLGSDEATTEQRGQLAQAITGLITTEVLEQAAEDAGITVTEEELDAEVEEVIATGFGGDAAAFDAQLESSGVSMEVARDQLRATLIAERLVDEEILPVDPETVRETYDLQFNVPTVAHIQTETREQAEAALERIEGGEDFAAVAAEVSVDASGAQGGELGPFQPGVFPPAFEEVALALEPGEVSDPVETEVGFHLIQTGEPLTFEEVEGPLTDQLEQQNVTVTFGELLNRYEQEAEITVDPAFGEWVGVAQGGLVPPGLETEVQQPPPPAPTEGG